MNAVHKADVLTQATNYRILIPVMDSQARGEHPDPKETGLYRHQVVSQQRGLHPQSQQYFATKVSRKPNTQLQDCLVMITLQQRDLNYLVEYRQN